MSADVVSLPDMWERARKRAEEPSEPLTTDPKPKLRDRISIGSR
jgi:hypothetical protein